MAKYGLTWWGAQWLNALSNIDWDNRLPRGRTYANNGSVKDVKIAGNTIRASVRGSRPSPYKVSVTVPLVTSQEADLLLDNISRNPVLISRLLNRELDTEVQRAAEGSGIWVFPKKWTDLQMECSCPDWAVPCKHLAAVIYKVSQEIDNNPFLVFQFRGLDLVKSLKERNISIAEEAKVKFSTVRDILQAEPEKARKKAGGKAEKEIGEIESSEASYMPHVDYTQIDRVLEALIRILPDAPPFYNEGNFRWLYEKVLKSVSKKALRFFDGMEKLPQLPALVRGLQGNQEMDLRFADEVILVRNGDHELDILVNGKSVTMYQLTNALQRIPQSQLPDYHISTAALYHLQMLALNLLEKGAVVPQIFLTESDDYMIRWLPAVIDKNVRQIVQMQEKSTPAFILRFKDEKQEMKSGNPALSVCSAFLDHLIMGWGDQDYENDTVSMFFNCSAYEFSGVGEKNVPAGIASWISRLNIAYGQFVPMLMVQEDKDAGRFSLGLEIESREKEGGLPVSLADVISLKKYEKDRFRILQNVTLLSNFLPGLNEYIASGARKPIQLGSQGIADFLFESLPALKLLDIKTILPKSLEQLYRPRQTVSLKMKQQQPGASFIRLDDLLTFDRCIAIGDSLLTETEFRKLVRQSRGILKFRDVYVYLDPKELEKLQKVMDSPARMSGPELLRTALSGEYMGAPVILTDEVKEMIRSLTETKEIPLPAGLQATLRPYQQRGYSWMYRNTQLGFGSLIADDMGLGKTLQVITALLKFREQGLLADKPALVVVPTSLLTNWARELEKFAPDLKALQYHGPTRRMEKNGFDVLLTTYGLVRSDLDKFKEKQWFVLVADEAQNIKNIDTAQTKALKSIPASTFIAMSGTPVENRLSEYWSIMDFANRGLLGTLPYFQKEIALPIQNHRDQTVLSRFRKVTEPFLMRRLKSDKTIISDLPDKVEMDQFASLTAEQAAIYTSTLEQAMAEIAGVGESKERMFERQGLVLQMIMALKQICNHPAQFLKNKNYDPAISGKVNLLLELLESILGNHEKTLIFTQFTEMAEMLQGFIRDRFGIDPLYLHGGQSRKQRDEMVQRFQNNRGERIFILSLKAGGTGLNLTAAQNVIHYDLWWNPAVEAQATDRAYRIGQQKNVLVHRFITHGTFEEKINEMIQSKKELAEMSVSSGEGWIGNLSSRELKDIFTLRAE